MPSIAGIARVSTSSKPSSKVTATQRSGSGVPASVMRVMSVSVMVLQPPCRRTAMCSANWRGVTDHRATSGRGSSSTAW